MRPSLGRCDVCIENEAVRTCPRCGRLVCSEDFDPTSGVCLVCAMTVCEICGKNISISSCALCGRLVCSACSVRAGLARYCVECVREVGTSPGERRDRT